MESKMQFIKQQCWSVKNWLVNFRWRLIVWKEQIYRICLGADNNRPTIVTFTGGMGAQIISAAIYFSMKDAGRSVYADLSYFDRPESIAVVGKTGDCSHWSWQLEPFGLSASSFEISSNCIKQKANILQDGDIRKADLALAALTHPDIHQFFRIPNGISDILPMEFEEGFLCMHIRRGDYVNVASHLVVDDEFINLARKFSGLVDSIVIISDSPIEPSFRNVVSSMFKLASFLDNTDAYTAHRVMRNSRILICSNSQFSLTAAALNPDALVLVPIQWFGGGHRRFEATVNSRCSFQIMENKSAMS